MTPSLPSDPSYPIGRFVRRDVYADADRAAHVARIAAQPGTLAAMLDGLDEHDFAAPYRPGGWTVGQLVHHLADSHLNAYIRVKLGLTEQEPTIKPYDQDAWVQLADASTLSPHVSVALLAATHIRLHTVLVSMRAEQFARRLVHPENGVMTLDQVAAMYAWHGDHHLAHLEQYRTYYRAARG
ncbi:YfiT family bacillithiol transferase [Gemmatimonas sp.]|uniref:YfiT family bacillithiol transferase n=1 Tax=Gemmatimonas sp. TaxID=1962908 RepID=UPI0025C6F4A9|nr:putative metal-dependent hydrolase [Gemmatimonas sp.]MCA2987007.1 putative metal-dependent hydrolase [Gemmatimonas sp.]MCA2994524.1 putative metal-dependent hydrolase [Gemmatimonas sp.]